MKLNLYAFTKKWKITGKYNELWNKFSSTIKTGLIVLLTMKSISELKWAKNLKNEKSAQIFIKIKYQRSFSMYLLVGYIHSFCFQRKLKLLSSSVPKRMWICH